MIEGDDWESDFKGNIEGGKIKQFYTVTDMNDEIQRVLNTYFSFCSAEGILNDGEKADVMPQIGGLLLVPYM